MTDFVVIPDTACDLTADLRERFGITDYLHGILYHPDGRSEVCSLDWDTMTAEEYYRSMKGRKALYTTATPPLGEVMDIFEKYLSRGQDVLSISLSAGLSSSYANTVSVANELLQKYPDRKIVCIDSKRYSTALSLLVIEACKQRDAGKTIDETAEYLLSIRDTVHQMGSMDDLFFLVKTGRVTNFKAFFGSMISLNVLADFNEKGMAQVVGKCKGSRNAINATIAYMKQTIVGPQEQIVFVAHTDRAAAAQLLADRIQEEFSPKEIIINTVGAACGATIGPGLCAAFYRGVSATEGLVKEQEIMSTILQPQQK